MGADAATSAIEPTTHASEGTDDAIDALRAQWARKRPDLDTSPVATIGRLLRIAKHVTAVSDSALAEFGIGRGEFDVLSAVYRSAEAPTPSQLARVLLASNASITKRLVQLEKAGLALRRRSASDGRVVTVALTPEGVERIDAALPAQLAAEAVLADVLTPDQLAELERSLHRLLLVCERTA